MKKIILLFVNVLVSMVLMADNVTVEQAEQIATQFLNSHRPSARKQLRMARRQPLDVQMVSDASAYYVFNVGTEDGFVVVSGSDLAPRVLAFSEKGAFSEETLPPNMQAWLDGYADQIAYLERTGGKAEAPRLNVPRNSVSPLLTSTWEQTAPYNNKCPIDPQTGNRCVTGCVATAMAQVINYHKYPSSTKAVIPAYTTGKRGIRMPAIGITDIDWDNMLNNYTGSETQAQENAVAQLMLLCGQAVGMDYNYPESGISLSSMALEASALQRYFGYDQTVRALERSAFGTEEWENLIYDEVANGRPVLYNGLSSGGGHAFVVDGYDRNGLFHVNWGWGGQSDGFFALSVLNPNNNNGTGASSSSDGFSFEQNVVVGIQHGSEQVIAERFTVSYMINTGATSYARSKKSVDFTGVSVGVVAQNKTGGEHNFNLGIMLVDADGNPASDLLAFVEEGSDVVMNGTDPYIFKDLSFGANLPNGDYYIIPVSASENSEEWEPCWGANRIRIKATIGNIRLTLANPTVDMSATMQTPDFCYSGEPFSLQASVKNNGSYFNDYVYLCEYVTTSEGSGYYMLGGRMFELGEGQTGTFDIDYMPVKPGQHNLSLFAYDQAGNPCFLADNQTVTVLSPLDYTVLVTNATEDVVIGGKVKAAVNITAAAALNGTGRLRLFKKVGSDYDFVEMKDTHIYLSPGASTSLNFEFEDLEDNQEYALSFIYQSSMGYPIFGYLDGTFSTDVSKVTLTLRNSPSSGTVSYGQEITLTANKPGAQIFYTTDGSEPTRGSYSYSSPVPVLRNMTLKAKAFLEGYIDSEVLTATYQAKLDIRASLASGSVWVGDKLVLTCSHPDAVIYYTTDGSSPSRTSLVYSSPIVIDRNMTVKAVSIHDDCLQSDFLTRTFTVPVVSLSASPVSGTVQKGSKVTLTSTPSDADIYYTLDGTEPNESSTKYTSSGITIQKNTTLKAISYRQGYIESSVLSTSYNVKLTLSASLAAGTVDYLSEVELHADDEDATIYYTTDGSTPTNASQVYTGPIVIDRSTTIKAIAYHDDYLTSDLLTRTYTVLVTSVTASPLTSDRLVAGMTIELAASPSDSRIYYTMDGSEPTEASTLYSGPIVALNTFTLKAKAFRDGYRPNDTYTWNYNVAPEPRVITVTPANLELFWGRTARLTYAFTPSDAETLTQEWASSNPEVATIDQEGNVRALTPGHTTMMLTTRNGVVGKCELTVPIPFYKLFVWTKAGVKTGYVSTDKPQFSVEGDTVHFTTDHLTMDILRDTLDRFTLEPVLPEQPKYIIMSNRMTLPLGQSEQLTVNLRPDKTKTKLKWFNDNSKVVSVTQDGTVTALNPGVANVMVQTSNGLHATCLVTVPEPFLRFFVWLKNGEVHGYDLDEHPEVALGDSVFTLTSSRQKVEYKAADIMMFTLQDEALVDGVTLPKTMDEMQFSEETLQLAGCPPYSSVQIYDTAGRLVQTATTDGEGSLTLPLASLRAGIYIIRTKKTTLKIQKR